MPHGTKRHVGESGRSSRRTFLKSAGVASAVGVTSLSGCMGGGSDAVRLGMAFPFTGPYSEEAKTQRQGVELAVQEINDNGGLDGRDVETIERDTELDGNTSTRRIQDLINNEDIDLLVANLSGGISLQTNSIAKQNDVPYMAACQTIPDFHRPDFLYDCSYTPYALNVQSQRANGRYIMNNLGESVFGIYADYAWGQNSWMHQKNVINNRGGSIAGEAAAPLGNSDFSSQLNSASESDADVLYIQNIGSDQANSVKQAREFGLQNDMEIFVGVTTVTVARRAGLDQWDGIHAGIYYSANADNPATNEFASKMNEEFGNPGDSYSAVTYTGVKEFERAINSAGSVEPADITSALNENPGFTQTKTQENWRDCDNQAIQDWYIVEGKPESEQENDWDLFSVEGAQGGANLLWDCSEY